tara:strand:+ start:1733 stop:2110 length:378 start_codon:yes stop_codon:yes gene_type:complete
MRTNKKKQLKSRVKISALADLSKCNHMYLSKIINNKTTPSDELAERLAECANKLYGEEVFHRIDFTGEDEIFDQVINELCQHIAKELELGFMDVFKVLLCIEQATNAQKLEVIKMIRARGLNNEV